MKNFKMGMVIQGVGLLILSGISWGQEKKGETLLNREEFGLPGLTILCW